MKDYDVAIPITGTLWVTVEAESKSDAVDKALYSAELDLDNLEEWEAHRQISEGNILYAKHNRAYAQLAFGEEEG